MHTSSRSVGVLVGAASSSFAGPHPIVRRNGDHKHFYFKTCILFVLTPLDLGPNYCGTTQSEPLQSEHREQVALTLVHTCVAVFSGMGVATAGQAPKKSARASIDLKLLIST